MCEECIRCVHGPGAGVAAGRGARSECLALGSWGELAGVRVPCHLDEDLFGWFWQPDPRFCCVVHKCRELQGSAACAAKGRGALGS